MARVPRSLSHIVGPNLASTERRTRMSKSLTSIAVMLASIALAPGEASAMSKGEAISKCFANWGQWHQGGCPNCTTCFFCPVFEYPKCHYIVCDESTCDEVIFR